MITLRPALAADHRFMLDLEREVMETHAVALWGRFVPAEASAHDLARTRIVLAQGTPIGLIMTEPGEDHLRLRKLYLLPHWQGQGIGRDLLRIVRAEAAAMGLPLRLSVLRPNLRALAFYLREGMEPLFDTEERLFLGFPQPPQRDITPDGIRAA